MIQGYATLVKGDAGGAFPEELAVGVVGDFFGRPVEAVFVEALVRPETDGVEVVDQLTFDRRVDN